MLYLVFLVLVTVACVTPGTTKAVYLNLNSELVPVVFDAFKNCVDKLGSDSKTMEKIINWKFENNESENKLMYCFGTTSGYSGDDAILKKDKLLALIGDHKSKDEFIKALDECNKLKGSDKYETAFKIINCFRETSPILFKF